MVILFTQVCLFLIGLNLTDLTFIKQGNPDVVNGRRINFDKFARIATIIEDIQRLQKMPHNFSLNPELHGWLVQQLKDSRDIQELHELSLSIEPRERTFWAGEKEESERIDKLMKDKGFV